MSQRGLRRAFREDEHKNYGDLLASEPEQDLFGHLRAAESTGRPLGDDRFLSRIERRTGHVLKPGKRGPKPLEPESD
jgi:putative transposase